MFENQINPNKAQIVISDIHGYYASLAMLKRTIGYSPEIHQLIYLGDYIDRGPQSWEVVSEIMREVKEEEAIALMGNHERLCLDALDDTEKRLIWFMNGGDITLKKLKAIDKPSLMIKYIDFLSGLPLYIETDNFLFVHAGVNPAKTLKDQEIDDLLWIRDEFLWETDLSRVTDKVVVFGHTPTVYFSREAEVYFSRNKIGVDTGITRGLYLSALNLDTMTTAKVPQLKKNEGNLL